MKHEICNPNFFYFTIVNPLLSQTEELIKNGNEIIQITTFGKGQPILIINGGPGMNSYGFRSLAETLSKEHQTIIYDQRGTGKSIIPEININTMTIDLMVKDIEIIREHLNIDNWIILGHSFGGMLGSYYASKYPEKIKGLILSSSGGINLDLFSRLNITSRLSEKNRDSLSYWNSKISQGDTTYYARLQRGKYLALAYVYDESNVPIVAERLTQGNMAINRLVHQNMRNSNFDCTESLKKLKAPVLIIQGKDDIIDKRTADIAMDVIPYSTLVILDNCGHYGWLDRTDEYFESIYAYLNSLSD